MKKFAIESLHRRIIGHIVYTTLFFPIVSSFCSQLSPFPLHVSVFINLASFFVANLLPTNLYTFLSSSTRTLSILDSFLAQPRARSSTPSQDKLPDWHSIIISGPGQYSDHTYTVHIVYIRVNSNSRFHKNRRRRVRKDPVFSRTRPRKIDVDISFVAKGLLHRSISPRQGLRSYFLSSNIVGGDRHPGRSFSVRQGREYPVALQRATLR